MAYTDQSAEYDYKDLLTWQNLDAGAENDKYFQTQNANPSGNWAPTGAWTWTPGSAIVPITINQDNDAECLIIDSESATDWPITINGKRGLIIYEDITGGRGIYAERSDGLAQAESFPFVHFWERNSECTQNLAYFQNDGRGAAINVEATYIGALNAAVRIFHDGDSTNAVCLDLQGGQDDGTGGQFVTFKDGDATACGSIAQVSSGNITYNTSSDIRLKKDIHDTKYSLADLMKIKVRDFKWKKSSVKCTGLIAQEIIKIYPMAVSTGATPKDMMGVDYGRLTPLLIKAVQELSAKVGKLEKRNRR